MERLMRLADSVKVQINLAGDIIHHMNTFAHSVDIIRQSSNLNELLPLTVALFQRMADRRNVRLETRLPDAAVTVNTSPFFLMNLLWPCLDRTLVTAENRRTVLLGYDKHAEEVLLWLSDEAGVTASQTDDTLLAGQASVLADALLDNASLSYKGDRLIIRLPVNPKDGPGGPSTDR